MDKDEKDAYIRAEFQKFANEMRPLGLIGVLVVLAPAEEVEGGLIADVDVEFAGDSIITPQVVSAMLTLAQIKVRGTAASHVGVIPPKPVN